ncbi:class I SAM-dependent methyltransferase [Patescibacteria group bacterium]
MSKNSWNKIAKQYDRANSDIGDLCRRSILFPNLDFVIDKYSTGEALDIGCGTGLFAKKLHSKGFNVTAIDFSEEMIRIAKKHNGGVDYYIHDLEDSLKEKANSLDLVTSIMVFNNIDDDLYSFSLKEVHRVLKEDGVLLIVIPHPLYISEFENLIGINKSKYMSHQKASYIWQNGEPVQTDFYLRPLSFYINTISSSGFKLIKLIEPIPEDLASEEFPEDFPRKKEFPGFLIIECVK